MPRLPLFQRRLAPKIVHNPHQRIRIGQSPTRLHVEHRRTATRAGIREFGPAHDLLNFRNCDGTACADCTASIVARMDAATAQFPFCEFQKAYDFSSDSSIALNCASVIALSVLRSRETISVRLGCSRTLPPLFHRTYPHVAVVNRTVAHEIAARTLCITHDGDASPPDVAFGWLAFDALLLPEPSHHRTELLVITLQEWTGRALLLNLGELGAKQLSPSFLLCFQKLCPPDDTDTHVGGMGGFGILTFVVLIRFESGTLSPGSLVRVGKMSISGTFFRLPPVTTMAV